MCSIATTTWKHWVIYFSFLFIYVFKAAQGQRFCVGRSMEFICDYNLFAIPKNFTLKNVRIEKFGTNNFVKCHTTYAIKQNASRWMVDCGKKIWRSTTFKVHIYILHAKKSDAGKYKCTIEKNSGPKVVEDAANITIDDLCIGQALFLPGFSRGPELIGEFTIPEPSNPWPELFPLMEIVVKSYAILMAGVAVIALIIKCSPQCLCKRVMGKYAKSSEGSSSTSSSSNRKVNVKVYGGGSQVLAVVDDSYMQDDYQAPTGGLVLIPHTLRINPDPLENF